MIERAIENWLINTNERNFQIPFCQILLNKGHKIEYISTHRSMEQGKDIITINKSGDCCAFQLKTGDINLTTWRNIKGEINELIELPIIHPNIDKSESFNSFLVTNGEIADEVRIQIDQINEDNIRKKRKYSYLKTITGKKLLKDFYTAQGEFIPKLGDIRNKKGEIIPREYDDFYLFLELFLLDGSDFLPKGMFFNFLNNVIFKIPKEDSTKKLQKADKINAVSSSLVIVSYLLDPYQRKENYYALFEAWTCLAACIVRYVKLTKLDEKYWSSSLELIFLEITKNLEFLKEEAITNEFLKGGILGDSKIIRGVRAVIVLGSLASLEIHKFYNEEEFIEDDEFLKLITTNIDNLLFWGESAFPYYFNLIKYLELVKKEKIACDLLENIFLQLIERNSPRELNSFPNLYYSPEEVLENFLKEDITTQSNMQLGNMRKIIEEILNLDTTKNFREILPNILEIDTNVNRPNQIIESFLKIANLREIKFNQFSGSSFILEELVLMLARRGNRSILYDNWKKISHIRFEKFVPDNIEDIFVWHTREGTNCSRAPAETQSWADLVEKSTNYNVSDFVEENLNLLHFFILVCPHRADESIIGLLDHNY